ncbi:ArsR family transcriptional regulator [Picrophilus oshimae]|uniref:Transcriptional regulator, ArsR family n=1 Tax=Picrophilus torridus (strain ATCC 700027 / DSM 9790 / JCM 10055 / NBRC 100828 / KAW 2/3) TaxID=1122961 RepID=Q6L172_PICTO|nr:ArsR family transcriptional regulator [Picrophilus oshimae]AAT43280.1 transcriptional regulator, ArsR family [Picrophilus oshimae DSM 9789]SMD30413.1 transcriptional regulator, ArsR family [Picrophilus oshimae DSM 9789]
MASRIKVVNDVGELVTIFHAADTDVKRKLLLDLSTGWITMQQIEEKYGADGKKALLYLDKIKLIETQWTTGSSGPEKAYHTYYSSVQINLIGSMSDLSDIIYATTMSYDELTNYENRIISMMENNSIFIGDVIDRLGISQTFLKGIINRSSILQIKGYKIEKVADI